MKKVFTLLLIFTAILSVSTNWNYERLGDKNADLKVRPMPINTVATVTSSNDIKSVEVYSVIGNLVLERKGEGELDFTNLPSGYYMIKAYTSNGEIVKRVQKR